MTGSHSFGPVPQTMDVTSEININWFTIAKRCSYLLDLESTQIYTKMLLHVLVCDHHQGACTWAWLKLQSLETFRKSTSLWTMQWCGSILRQVRSGVYAVCSTGWDWAMWWLVTNPTMHHITQYQPVLHTAYKPLWTGHSMLPHHCTSITTYFYRTFLTILTLDWLKHKLPNDGHRSKYVGAF
jgi:hypothetical protein